MLRFNRESGSGIKDGLRLAAKDGPLYGVKVGLMISGFGYTERKTKD